MGHEFNRLHQSADNQHVHLTDLEINIIRMICEEKTTADMARILNINPRSIGRYREKLLVKTGSRGAIGILKYALRHRIFIDD